MDSIREDIAKIYNALSDDETKYIFANRLLFSFTNDEKYIENVIKTTVEGKEFYQKIEQADTKKVIFGAGFWGKSIAQQYGRYKFDCFVDNAITYSHEKIETGIPVISFEKYLKKYKDSATVFISSRLYYKEQLAQLIEYGVTQDRIVNAGKMIDNMSLRQYFDLPYMICGEREVFIDAGGFDGKTSKLFIKWCNNHYRKIYVLEPEDKNIKLCEENLSDCVKDNFTIIPFGLWDKKCRLNFIENANGISHISENSDVLRPNSTYIPVDTLDQLVDDEVTFIKMDIEGAEYEAIKGAEKTIKRYHPKLAISIYHKIEDIWKLPKLIMDICPDYKLYLRHYSITQAETVLYAI